MNALVASHSSDQTIIVARLDCQSVAPEMHLQASCASSALHFEPGNGAMMVK